MDSIEVKSTEDKGRSVFARRALRKGELVFTDEAFLVSHLPLLRESVHGYLPLSNFAPEQLSVSTRLTQADFDEIDANCQDNDCSPRLVHYLIFLLDQDETTKYYLRRLYRPSSAGRWGTYLKLAVKSFPASVLARSSEDARDEVQRFWWAHDANCFESVCDGCAEVYDTLCLFNHACQPNMYPHPVSNQTGKREIRALRNIAAGEELFISYLGNDELETTRARQHMLKQAKQFDCGCERCRRLDWFCTLRCPRCGQESVPFPAASSSDSSIKLVCQSEEECGEILDEDEVAALKSAERRVRNSIEEIESEDEPHSAEMLDAWQSVLAVADKSLGRAHSLYRQLLTHVRSTLLNARKIPAAQRVQQRILALVACGLSGYGRLYSESSSSSSSLSESSSDEIPVSRSVLTDATQHGEIMRAARHFPSFFFASQCEQFADLMYLIAASIQKQEQQNGVQAPFSSNTSAAAMMHDVATYFETALEMFECISGPDNELAEGVRTKLERIRPAPPKRYVLSSSSSSSSASVSSTSSQPSFAVEEQKNDQFDQDDSSPVAVLARSITAGVFSGLMELDLAKRGLTSLPSSIGSLSQLTKINLAQNPLSSLPDSFRQLTDLRTLFCLGCHFETIPTLLGSLLSLFMLSFKCNRLQHIPEESLAPSLNWLILTDNQLTTLPASLGKLVHLRKLMLATNRLTSLPDMTACESLELIRLSDNQLSADTLQQSGLLSLPKLSWIAWAGNPGSGVVTNDLSAVVAPHLLLNPESIAMDRVLGEGASGTVHLGNLTNSSSPSDSNESLSAIAIKVFKSASSDGRPIDEIRAAARVPSHPSLIDVRGVYQQPASTTGFDDLVVASPYSGRLSLVLELLDSAKWVGLGNPPSFHSVTRDVFSADLRLSLPLMLRILHGIASAAAHFHSHGVAHGDLYAHNIMFRPIENDAEVASMALTDSLVKLGDFGAGFCYDRAAQPWTSVFERIEVRAFGCLVEDLLGVFRSNSFADVDSPIVRQLEELQEECMQTDQSARPLFADILTRLVTSVVQQ